MHRVVEPIFTCACVSCSILNALTVSHVGDRCCFAFSAHSSNWCLPSLVTCKNVTYFCAYNAVNSLKVAANVQ